MRLLGLTLAVLAFASTPAPAADDLKFDNIRLLVTRFDDAFAFYRDVLSLTPTSGGPGENYASFTLPGGGQLALFKRELMAAAVGAADKPVARTGQDTVALVFSVADVDAAYARLSARGVRFASTPESRQAWGIRTAHFRDPDGNLIELYSPLRK